MMRDNIARFMALDALDKTSEAELADVRVGADGTIYENAGTAVRTQIGELKEDLSELEQQAVALFNGTDYTATKPVLDSYQMGYVHGVDYNSPIDSNNTAYGNLINSNNGSLNIQIKTGYKIYIVKYKSDGTYIAGTTWYTGSITYMFDSDCVAIEVRKSDNSAFTLFDLPSDVVTITSNILIENKTARKVDALEQTAIPHIIDADILPTIPHKVRRINGAYSVDDVLSKMNVSVKIYISKSSGSDSNEGSETEPVATIKKAVELAGYTSAEFIIKDGIYYIDDVVTPRFDIYNDFVLRAENEAIIVSGVSSNGYTNVSDDIYTITVSAYTPVGCVDMSSNNVDEYGIHKPMTKVSSASEVNTTPNSYFINGGIVTVNTEHISDIVVITNNYGFRTLLRANRDITVYLENIRFVGKNYIIGRNTIEDAPNNSYCFVAKNCVFEHAVDYNNLKVDSYDDIYCIDCKCGYAKLDCFNYHGYNMTEIKRHNAVIVEVNCFAEYAGYYNTDGYSDNLSTVHDSLNVLRCNFNGHHADGAMIADIDGCHSVMIDCTVYNNYFTKNIPVGAIACRKTTSGFTGRDSIAILQNCHCYDVRNIPRFIIDNCYVSNMDFDKIQCDNIKVSNEVI